MIRTNDTVAAIATPLGEGGLGVIRLSGPHAFTISDRLFTGRRRLSGAATHTLHHGTIRSGDTAIDDVVAAVFRSPSSYTGEDVVEISCHGSPALLKDILELCFRAGARPAEPGEFTLRAFLNGKMDLAQAEAVAELIQARSRLARDAARDRLEGRLSKEIQAIRRPLVDLLARLEANLDFVEEDIPALSRSDLVAGVKRVMTRIQTLLRTQAQGRILKDGLRVVLVGRPNVGKSSLFNALLANDRAIVTDRPGTTRDVLEETVQWNGVPVVLIDTAGVRSATNVIEREGVKRARSAQQAADVVLWVVEARNGPTADDRRAVRRLNGKKKIVVFNKIDLGGKKNGAASYSVCTSAINVQGLEDLKSAVLKRVGGHFRHPDGAPVLANQRQARHLENSWGHLRNASESARKLEEEALALDIRNALKELGYITGDDVSEDVLHSIFSQFCIGK